MKRVLDKVGEAFARLSDTERKVAVAVGTAVFSLSVLAIGVSASRGLDAAERRVSHKAEQLKQVILLRGNYKAGEEESKQVRALLSRNKVRLLAYLEGIARDLNIVLENMTPRDDPPNDAGISVSSVTLRAQRLSHDKVSSFLKRIEENREPVRVVRMKLQKRYDDKELLDAEMTVATYKAQ